MSAQSDPGAPEDWSTGADDADASADIPEWAPLEPLPSSEMFLATFSGGQPVTASDILHPAYDLVECQRGYRLAFEALTDTSALYDELKAAAATLTTAQSDIEMLVTIIDDAVADRVKRQPEQSADVARRELMLTLSDGPAQASMHTESIGEIVARMADLWEAVTAKSEGQGSQDFPEAGQLLELCRGYDCLAAEIESGRRRLPGM
jgi:hypothetical protein